MDRDINMFIDSLLIGSIIVMILVTVVLLLMKAKDTYQNRK